jgi:hypothetical protein
MEESKFTTIEPLATNADTTDKFSNEHFYEVFDQDAICIEDDGDSNSFYIVEIRKYYPKGSTPHTEHSCLFLSNKLDNTINFIQDDVNDSGGFTSNGRDYHWYWVIIKMKLNDDTGEIVKVFDKNGKETTERIMLDLD